MARVVNIEIDQGTTFTYTTYLFEANGAPVNLTSFVGRASVRKHPGCNTAVSFNVTLGGSTGTVVLLLTPNQTATLKPGRHVYDVTLTSNTGNVSRVLEGDAFVNASVTR